MHAARCFSFSNVTFLGDVWFSMCLIQLVICWFLVGCMKSFLLKFTQQHQQLKCFDCSVSAVYFTVNDTETSIFHNAWKQNWIQLVTRLSSHDSVLKIFFSHSCALHECLVQEDALQWNKWALASHRLSTSPSKSKFRSPGIHTGYQSHSTTPECLLCTIIPAHAATLSWGKTRHVERK